MPIEPSTNVRAQLEMRLDDANQHEPADERQENRDQVDQHRAAASSRKSKPPGEDVADLFAIPPDHEPSSPKASSTSTD